MKILADASLPYLKEAFHPAFQLTPYHSPEEVKALLPNHDILLCRSTLKVTANLLARSQIQCVATASSGTDHIDHAFLNQNHIKLIEAKGSNAKAVANYVLATIAILLQDKELMGYKAGIIGLGYVGTLVRRALAPLGFDIFCYDPIKALEDHTTTFCTFQELTQCDLLCVHANLHSTEPYPSFNLIQTDFLDQLKPKTAIINAARGEIINETSLLALNKPLTYCTDVYSDEPTIAQSTVDFAKLCTPHIAGHSLEAKYEAVVALSQKLHHYYNLPMPNTPSPSPEMEVDLTGRWQEPVLSIYNPLEDTKKLKKAVDKTQAFLTQRKTHHRHQFNF